MPDRPAVLVLCAGNSARSILGEGLLRRAGFDAHSAGSQPRRTPHPMALRILTEAGIDAAFARSKSWDEFADRTAGAPDLDVVITVCDTAAGEACPLWHGSPIQTHWGMPDPAAVGGSDATIHSAFKATFSALEEAVERFAALPFHTLDAGALKAELDAIGDDVTRRAAGPSAA